ncbi:MAG: TonB family protein, partial [Gammaproteobacteria bacterium]|nr:TonB family protein [Gammaproteobacteria bacterium]
NDGTAKLIDFGAATGHAITEATPIQGAHTPAYASCEVIEGAKPTIQDDVFSMACVIYRILAGHRAFGTCNALEAERNKLEPARLRFLPSKQWKALRKALAFRRKQRTQTVSEFLRAFTPPQTQWEQRPKSRYRPNLKAGLSAVAAIIAAVAIILLWPDSEPQPVVGSLPGQQQLMHQSMPEQTIFEEMEEPVPIVETTENQTVPLQNELINNTDNGEVSTASEAPDAEDMDTPEPEALPTAEAEPALDRLELRIAELVTSADDAMNNGQLLEPAEDNASAYITALNVLTPEDARTVQLKQRLADLMLLEAMVAVSDEEFDKADDWITEAKTLGLSQAKADRFDNELLKARETKANRQSQQFDTIFASASPAAILSDPPANKAISDNFMDFSDEPDGSPAMVAFALSGAANNGATGQVADTQAEAADNQPPEISNEISMSELEFETFAEPQYPRRASIRKLSGAVEVRFRINTNGKTDDIRVISSEPPGRFNKAAITAVNKWRFKPVLENGVATEKYSSVRFSFKP